MKAVAARETEASSSGVARRSNRGFALKAPGHRMPAMAQRQVCGGIGAVFGPANRNDGAPLQAGSHATAQLEESPVTRDEAATAAVTPSTPNRAGLPAALKAGLEALSGCSMDQVRVHYNSARPAQLNAVAYAQGSDIHLATGQERHLAHEAWHVVQQAQGRVRPTLQASGVAINDDGALEQEATAMGAQAERRGGRKAQARDAIGKPREQGTSPLPRGDQSHAPVQRTVLSKVYELKRGGTKTVYYSTYSPSEEFDDQFAAWRRDTELAREADSTDESDERFPTNVSYYRAKPRNVMGTSDQGPHSLSHSSLSHRVSKRMKGAESARLKEVRDRQIPPPAEFRKMLEAEKPGTMKQAAVERMIADYKLSYDRLDQLLKAGKADAEVRRLIRRLLQMNPYAAYGKGKKTGKRNIKGKGERADDPFDEAFDAGAKFRDEEGYGKFKGMRKELYSSEEEFAFGEDEGHVKKKAKKSTAEEDDDDDILAPIDVMVLLGRAARGALYIMRDDDWPVYEQYKRDHPDKRYSR